MRLFVALDLPAALVREVGRRAAEARRELPRARWAKPEALHLTLAFLGETDEADLPALHRYLRPAFAEVRPFGLRLEDAGTFPLRRPARVAWVGVQAPPALADLAQGVQQALAQAVDFAPDRRHFHAHLTVARCKKPWRRREVERFQRHFEGPLGDSFAITEGVLYESVLRPDGARYQALERYPLGETAAASAASEEETP